MSFQSKSARISRRRVAAISFDKMFSETNVEQEVILPEPPLQTNNRCNMQFLPGQSYKNEVEKELDTYVSEYEVAPEQAIQYSSLISGLSVSAYEEDLKGWELSHCGPGCGGVYGLNRRHIAFRRVFLWAPTYDRALPVPPPDGEFTSLYLPVRASLSPTRGAESIVPNTCVADCEENPIFAADFVSSLQVAAQSPDLAPHLDVLLSLPGTEALKAIIAMRANTGIEQLLGINLAQARSWTIESQKVGAVLETAMKLGNLTRASHYIKKFVAEVGGATEDDIQEIKDELALDGLDPEDSLDEEGHERLVKALRSFSESLPSEMLTLRGHAQFPVAKGHLVWPKSKGKKRSLKPGAAERLACPKIIPPHEMRDLWENPECDTPVDQPIEMSPHDPWKGRYRPPQKQPLPSVFARLKTERINAREVANLVRQEAADLPPISKVDCYSLFDAVRGRAGWYPVAIPVYVDDYGSMEVLRGWLGVDPSEVSDEIWVAPPDQLARLRLKAVALARILEKSDLTPEDYTLINDFLGSSACSLRLSMSAERGSVMAYEHCWVVSHIAATYANLLLSYENTDGSAEDADLRLYLPVAAEFARYHDDGIQDGTAKRDINQPERKAEEVYIDIYTGSVPRIAMGKVFKSEKKCRKAVLWIQRDVKDRFEKYLNSPGKTPAETWAKELYKATDLYNYVRPKVSNRTRERLIEMIKEVCAEAALPKSVKVIENCDGQDEERYIYRSGDMADIGACEVHYLDATDGWDTYSGLEHPTIQNWFEQYMSRAKEKVLVRVGDQEIETEQLRPLNARMAPPISFVEPDNPQPFLKESNPTPVLNNLGYQFATAVDLQSIRAPGRAGKFEARYLEDTVAPGGVELVTPSGQTSEDLAALDTALVGMCEAANQLETRISPQRKEFSDWAAAKGVNVDLIDDVFMDFLVLADALQAVQRVMNMTYRRTPESKATPYVDTIHRYLRLPLRYCPGWVYVRQSGRACMDKIWFMVAPARAIPNAEMWSECLVQDGWLITRPLPYVGEDTDWFLAAAGVYAALKGNAVSNHRSMSASTEALYTMASMRSNTQNMTAVPLMAKYIVAGMSGRTNESPVSLLDKLLVWKPRCLGDAVSVGRLCSLIGWADHYHRMGWLLPQGRYSYGPTLPTPAAFFCPTREEAQEAYCYSSLFCKDRLKNVIGQMRVADGVAEIAIAHSVIREKGGGFRGILPPKVKRECFNPQGSYEKKWEKELMSVFEAFQEVAFQWEEEAADVEEKFGSRKYVGNPAFMFLLSCALAWDSMPNEWEQTKVGLQGATELFGPSAGYDSLRKKKVTATVAMAMFIASVPIYAADDPTQAVTAVGVARHAALGIMKRRDVYSLLYMFAKQQLGGPRDISVMEAQLKAITWAIEAYVDPITSLQPGQYLSDSNKNEHMQAAVYTAVTEAAAFPHDFSCIGLISDASAWGHTMDGICMLAALLPRCGSDPARTDLTILFPAFQSKRLMYPIQVTELLKRMVKNGDKLEWQEERKWGTDTVHLPAHILGNVLRWFKREGSLSEVRLETGMMMGLVNKASSFYHTLILEALAGPYFLRKGTHKCTFLCTSDDALEILTSQGQFGEYCRDRQILHDLAGIITNTKKTYAVNLASGSSGMAEINSMFFEASECAFRPTPLRFVYPSCTWPGIYAPTDWATLIADRIDRLAVEGAPVQVMEGVFAGNALLWYLSAYKDLDLFPKFCPLGSMIAKNSWVAIDRAAGEVGIRAEITSQLSWCNPTLLAERLGHSSTTLTEGTVFSVARIGKLTHRQEEARVLLASLQAPMALTMPANTARNLLISIAGRLERYTSGNMWDTTITGRLKDWASHGSRLFQGRLTGPASAHDLSHMYENREQILEACSSYLKAEQSRITAIQTEVEEAVRRVRVALTQRQYLEAFWSEKHIDSEHRKIVGLLRRVMMIRPSPTAERYHQATLAFVMSRNLEIARMIDPSYAPTEPVLAMLNRKDESGELVYPVWEGEDLKSGLARAGTASLSAVSPVSCTIDLYARSSRPETAIQQHARSVWNLHLPHEFKLTFPQLSSEAVDPEIVEQQVGHKLHLYLYFGGTTATPIHLKSRPVADTSRGMLRTWEQFRRYMIAKSTCVEVPTARAARRAIIPPFATSRNRWDFPWAGVQWTYRVDAHTVTWETPSTSITIRPDSHFDLPDEPWINSIIFNLELAESPPNDVIAAVPIEKPTTDRLSRADAEYVKSLPWYAELERWNWTLPVPVHLGYSGSTDLHGFPIADEDVMIIDRPRLLASLRESNLCPLTEMMQYVATLAPDERSAVSNLGAHYKVGAEIRTNVMHPGKEWAYDVIELYPEAEKPITLEGPCPEGISGVTDWTKSPRHILYYAALHGASSLIVTTEGHLPKRIRIAWVDHRTKAHTGRTADVTAITVMRDPVHRRAARAITHDLKPLKEAI